jgi:hypothetical protein
VFGFLLALVRYQPVGGSGFFTFGALPNRQLHGRRMSAAFCSGFWPFSLFDPIGQHGLAGDYLIASARFFRSYVRHGGLKSAAAVAVSAHSRIRRDGGDLLARFGTA